MSVGFGAGTYATLKGSLIYSRYVRLKFATAGSLIIGAGINTSLQ